MPYGLYISAEGAKAQSARLDVISHNLANVNTAGFKHDLARLQARHAEAVQRGAESPGTRTVNDVGGGVQVRDTITSYAPGVYDRTGRKLDFAVNGEGFFHVRKGDQDYLTRAGSFQFDPRGTLTTDQGYAVLGRDGGPITIDAQQDWGVTYNGGIVQGGEVRELALVQPAELADLAKAGENLFKPLADVSPVEDARRHIQSGVLEQSSVRPIQAMTAMIDASRAFEANVKLIQNQDHMLGTLINRVLITN